jgi:PAS domain S-box-containing protein
MTFATAAFIDAKDEERHRRHELLKASEARLSGILSIAADAIISVDNQQRITLFNTWAEKIFGYSQSDVIGRPLEVLIPERFRSAHKRHVTEFGKSPISARRMGERQEIFARRKDGEEFPAEASISKLKLDGQAIYTVVLRDMTDQRRAAEALVSAKEEAEAAARSKADFLANMSHEIRTPLNSISGFTQLLFERPELAGAARDQLSKIKSATAGLITIVNDILDYSKLEEGRLSLSLSPFSPAELARSCASMISSITNRRDLPILVTESPELHDRFFLGDT